MVVQGQIHDPNIKSLRDGVLEAYLQAVSTCAEVEIQQYLDQIGRAIRYKFCQIAALRMFIVRFSESPPTIKSLGIRYLTTLGIDISIPCRLSGISSGASSWERVAMKVVRPWPPTVGSKCEQGCGQILNGFTLCRDISRSSFHTRTHLHLVAHKSLHRVVRRSSLENN
jgi:hypothetical protein